MSNNIIMSGEQVAELLSSDLTSVYANYEWVEDPNSAYGYKSTLVLRTDGTNNTITMGNGSANSKLGFLPGSYSFGNFSGSTIYNTDNQSEYAYDATEIYDLNIEGNALTTIINSTTPNLLNRASPTNISLCNASVKAKALDESIQISSEMSKLNTQISSLSKILLEPTMPSYTDSSVAYSDASSFLNDCSNAIYHDTNIATNYAGKTYASQWILNVNYDTSSIHNVTGQSTFTIQVPTDQTRKILNAAVDNTSYFPSVTYADTGLPIPGTWSGWDPAADSSYSNPTNVVTFFSGTLRDCIAHYYTMDSQNLNDRTSFVTERLENVNNRIIYLTDRMNQIKQHIIDEEYFMATDGTNTGNLYNWAANRFNRSNGSEARLKQIEKTIEMNQSSLSVSKQFL